MNTLPPCLERQLKTQPWGTVFKNDRYYIHQLISGPRVEYLIRIGPVHDGERLFSSCYASETGWYSLNLNVVGRIIRGASPGGDVLMVGVSQSFTLAFWAMIAFDIAIQRRFALDVCDLCLFFWGVIDLYIPALLSD